VSGDSQGLFQTKGRSDFSGSAYFSVGWDEYLQAAGVLICGGAHHMGWYVAQPLVRSSNRRRHFPHPGSQLAGNGKGGQMVRSREFGVPKNES
jgi:hypothetical protein